MLYVYLYSVFDLYVMVQELFEPTSCKHFGEYSTGLGPLIGRVVIVSEY